MAALDSVIEVALVVDTAVYADGDVLANPVEVVDAVHGKGYTTRLVSVTLTDKADQKAAVELIFLKKNVTLGAALNAAPDIADADIDDAVLGRVAIAATDYSDLGGGAVATKSNIDLLLKADIDKKSIYVGVISKGTPDYVATGDLKLKLGFER